jgi:hypothetical protein
MKEIIKMAAFLLMTLMMVSSCKKELLNVQEEKKDAYGIPCTLKEVDLDITANGPYSFTKNWQEWYFDGPYGDFFDVTDITLESVLPPHEFYISIKEFAAPELMNTVYTSDFKIVHGHFSSSFFVEGNCSIPFKKLIVDGGGPFEGTLTLTGSASICYRSPHFPPLTLTGNLNVINGTISLRIKGKTYL